MEKRPVRNFEKRRRIADLRFNRVENLNKFLKLRYPVEESIKHLELVKTATTSRQINWSEINESINYLKGFSEFLTRKNSEKAKGTRSILRALGEKEIPNKVIVELRGTNEVIEQIKEALKKIEARRKE